MEQKNQQNGARAKILRALADADCGLTTAELAESAGLTAGQVRDNAGVAKRTGLLTIEQDETTRFVTYHIAQKGRDWLKSGKDDDKPTVADPGEDGEDHQSHYAPEDRGETASAPTGVWPRYPAKSDCRYATCSDGGDLRYSRFDDLYEIINEAVSEGSRVTVFQLVEVGRTETRTVFVPV